MTIKNIVSRRNRILLRELIVTDFKLRYQGSVLGYAWSLLKPLFLFAILYTVFGVLLDFGESVPHFGVYLLLGIVLWEFFNEATGKGVTAIVGRGDLIRKTNFPKYIIIISDTTSALVNFCFNIIIVFFFMWLAGVNFTWSILLLPLLVVELYILVLAIAFFLSAFYVKFRDISYLWEVILRGAFYATPILYPLTLVIGKSEFAAKLLMLSPVAQIIQDTRQILITEETITTYDLFNGYWYAYIPFIIIAVIVVAASWYFKKSQKYFAENV